MKNRGPRGLVRQVVARFLKRVGAVFVIGDPAKHGSKNGEHVVIDAGKPRTGGLAAIIIGATDPLGLHEGNATNIIIGHADADLSLDAPISGDVALRRENDHTIAPDTTTTAATVGAALTVRSAHGKGAAGGEMIVDTGDGNEGAGGGTGGTVKVGPANADIVELGRTGKEVITYGIPSRTTQQTISSAGETAISLDVESTICAGSTAANDVTSTLPAFSASAVGCGDHWFYMITVFAGKTWVITTADGYGFTQITLATAADMVHLKWFVGVGWVVAGTYGTPVIA